MNFRITLQTITGAGLPLLLCVVAIGSGCQKIGLHTADPAEPLRGAVVDADAVQFQTHGEPVDVHSQTSPALTLSAAVQSALRHDPGLQAALARVRSAQADAEQARLLPNPVLSVALRFPEAGVGKPVIEAGLAADLLSILQQPRRVSAADNRLRAASAESLTIALDLVAEVQQRYAAVQALDAELAVLVERRDLVARLLDLAKARVQAGEAPQLDVLTLDTERLGIEADIIEKTATRTDERLRLARLMGQPSGGADWTLPAWQPPQSLPVAESSWVSLALQYRPEIQAQRWELAALGDAVALTRFAVFEGLDAGIDAERDPDWAVGPAITTPVPVLDWGQARSAKAESDRIEARHKLTQVRRQVVEEVRRAAASLAWAQRGLAMVRDELIPVQKRRREQAEAQYRNGFADITAVLLAEQDLKAASVNLVELQQNVSVAHLRLERAIGGSAIARDVASTTCPTTKAASTNGSKHALGTENP